MKEKIKIQKGFIQIPLLIIIVASAAIAGWYFLHNGEGPIDPCANINCPTCHYCEAGNCIVQPDGYNDCGSGCQRCVDGSCQDYDQICSERQHCESDSCVCNEGYVRRDEECLSYTEACIQKYGPHVYGEKKDEGTFNCICEDGYEWDLSDRCIRSTNCEGTDISCGRRGECVNCNDKDGCIGNILKDYHCANNSCVVYTSNDCSEDCSCSCGGYNIKESIANENCNDGKDNDCDGLTDLEESACKVVSGGINLITRVIDGDTFDVLLADGTEDRIRLLGVDTPEKSGNQANEYDLITDTACLDTWGIKATDYAKSMLENKEVELIYDPIAGERGYYGRLLAYVEINEQDFGELLLKNGHARAYTESDFEKEDYYVSLQQGVEANEIGLWSCKEGPSPYDNPCIVYCEDKCLEKHSFFSPGYMLCFTGCLELCDIRNEIPF